MSTVPRRTVAVIGGGAMGSAAAWQLALRGHRVVLFEQYGPGHTRGASHGSSRIFRHAYPTRRYVALAARAARLWRQLERVDGQHFYARTGAVDHGDPASLHALAQRLSEAGLEHSLLRPSAAELQWPGLRFDTMVLHHAEAGRLNADLAVAAMQRRASAEGAEIWHHSPVTGIRVNASGVRVLTASGSIRFDQVVAAAGAWTAELLAAEPHLSREIPELTTTQEQPAHFVPLETPVGWPTFIHHPGAEYQGPGIYGLASSDGIKVGEHGTGPRVEPATRDFLPDPSGVARLRQYAANWLPGVDPTTPSATTCLYTTTPDHNFVVDRRGPITVAAGFSGHGFKFAPAIGELVAGLVNGTADAPDLFALGRQRQPVPVGGSRDE
jgi:sarcosine oxidase